MKKPLKMVKPPNRSFKKLMLNVLASILAGVKKKVLPQYTALRGQNPGIKSDSYGDTLLNLFAILKASHMELYDEAALRAEILGIAHQIADFNLNELKLLFINSLNVDPFLFEPWLDDEVKVFTQNNVAKIKSIQDNLFAELEEIFIRNIRAGSTYRSLAKELKRKFEITKNKSIIIARDQTNKFNANLNRIRQQQVGITKFKWRIVDRNTRDSHKKREGKIFAWKDGDKGVYPGDEVLCQCYAEPILDEVLT